MARKSFKGIFIRRELWENPDLTLQERVFLAEIESLSRGDRGCYANNNHFENLFRFSTRQVTRILAQLQAKNLVKIELFGGRKKSRKITPLTLTDLSSQTIHRVDKSDRDSRQICLGGVDKSVYTPRQDCLPNRTDLSSSYKEESTNPIPIENTIENTKDKLGVVNSFCDSDLALDLSSEKFGKKLGDFELTLIQILPPRNQAERTTFRRLSGHLAGEIAAGNLKLDIFDRLLSRAREAKSVANNPRAMFIAVAKQETGFAASAGPMLKGACK